MRYSFALSFSSSSSPCLAAAVFLLIFFSSSSSLPSLSSSVGRVCVRCCCWCAATNTVDRGEHRRARWTRTLSSGTMRGPEGGREKNCNFFRFFCFFLRALLICVLLSLGCCYTMWDCTQQIELRRAAKTSVLYFCAFPFHSFSFSSSCVFLFYDQAWIFYFTTRIFFDSQQRKSTLKSAR